MDTEGLVRGCDSDGVIDEGTKDEVKAIEDVAVGTITELELETGLLLGFIEVAGDEERTGEDGREDGEEGVEGGDD